MVCKFEQESHQVVTCLGKTLIYSYLRYNLELTVKQFLSTKRIWSNNCTCSQIVVQHNSGWVLRKISHPFVERASLIEAHRIYHDAVPGLTIEQTWFIPTKKEIYTLACSQRRRR